MNEQDLQHLKEEVATLRKIINVLLEQNEALKSENYQLKQEHEAKKEHDSPSQEGVVSKQPFHSTYPLSVTPSQLLHSLSESRVEQKQEINSLSEADVEPKQEFDSTTGTDIAPKQDIDSASGAGIAPKQSVDGSTGTGWGMKQEFAPLPLKLALSNENIGHLANQLLNAGFGGGKYSTMKVAAKLLLHFYNEQPGEYKYLLRLTDYSQGGLAKLMMNLRQKGSLIKCGFQQHAVTGKALELMQKAGCK